MDNKVKVVRHGGPGIIWVIGWLFTVGFLKQGFWTGALALIIWPWFLGAHFAEERPGLTAPAHNDRPVLENSTTPQ